MIKREDLLKQTLDFTGWKNIVGLTPTDIDMAFDNRGKQLICEYKCGLTQFSQIPEGQHRFYRNLVQAGKGLITAALVTHDGTLNDRGMIDTTKVISFQTMEYSVTGFPHYNAVELDFHEYVKQFMKR